MAQDEREMLELLRFELKFLEDGGYGRFPRTPWRPTFVFEDSPTCMKLGFAGCGFIRSSGSQALTLPCIESSPVTTLLFRAPTAETWFPH